MLLTLDGKVVERGRAPVTEPCAVAGRHLRP